MRRLTSVSVLWVTIAVVAAGWMPSGAAAQSISSGTLSGHVYDQRGSPLFDADVSLISAMSGIRLNAITARNGDFAFAFLSPGEYAVRVEAVGYRPVLVQGVSIAPGVSAPVTIRLTEEPPPVVAVDTIQLAASAAGRTRAGLRRWMGPLELSRLPENDRRASSLPNLMSDASPDGSMDGLPASFTNLFVDGIGFRPARVPGNAMDPMDGLLIPRSFLSGAEVTRSDEEVEFGGSGGAIVSALTRQGGPRPSVDIFADYTGGSLWTSQSIDQDIPTNKSIRAGFVGSLPIVPDSVHAVFGVETWRLERPRSPLSGATSALSGLGSAGGLDVPGLDAVTLEKWDAVSGFGRIDWQVGPESSVSVRGHVASVPESEADATGYPLSPRDATSVFGRDLLVAATVQSRFNDMSQLEVRAGVLTSTRTFRSSAGQGGFPQTTLASWPLEFGTNASLPGSAKLTQMDLAPVIHFDLGDHQVKAGTSVSVAMHEIDQRDAALGRFLASDASGVRFGQGFYDRMDGTGVTSDFTIPTFALFGQDMWSAAPGLQVVFGGRLEVDQLPEGDLQRPQMWDSLSAVPFMVFDTAQDIRSFSTRFGFTWDVGRAGTTFVRGSGGLAYQALDPYVMHQWLTGDGRRLVHRDLDPGTWPASPGGTTVSAPSLTVDVDYRRPRSTRGGVGLTRTFSSGLALHASTSFRRTEYLVRMRDLNLTPGPSGEDQFGRTVFGQLTQRGGILGARPSFNRRFPEIDRVYALVTDGWSEYRDASVILEKRGGPLEFVASYTFSRTEDNMSGWMDGSIDSGMIPQIGDEGTLWEEGLSDFDVPHRFVAGVDVELPVLEGVHLSGVYRFRSGEVFTPGFRPGVDANGDGSGYNDPAYIGGVDLGGVDPSWTCVRTQANGPVERNSCRGENVQSLDLRLTMGLMDVRGSTVEVVVDALGVIEPELGLRDRALYLVNPTGTMTRNGNTFNVPLTANPGFGEFSRRLDPGRILRIGLRIGR